MPDPSHGWNDTHAAWNGGNTINGYRKAHGRPVRLAISVDGDSLASHRRRQPQAPTPQVSQALILSSMKRPRVCSANGVDKSASKLPLHDLTAMARDVVRRHRHEVIGAIPAEGDSEYAELIVALNGDPGSSIKRLTIGVHRTQSRESIRDRIEVECERASKMPEHTY